MGDQLDIVLTDESLGRFGGQPVLLVGQPDTTDLLGLPWTVAPDACGAADPPDLIAQSS